jgi:hypothetical protein
MATSSISALLQRLAQEVDPWAPGFWRDFGIGMLKPLAATAAVAMAVALSSTQRLGIEAEMLYAIARSFLQLSVIGFVLHFIFTQKSPLWILLAYLFMVTVAGYTAGQRARRVPRGGYIAGVSILVGTGVTMFLLVVLSVFEFTPRYIIPIAGMMVGNAMTVTGVTMKKLHEDVKSQRNLVHRLLAEASEKGSSCFVYVSEFCIGMQVETALAWDHARNGSARGRDGNARLLMPARPPGVRVQLEPRPPGLDFLPPGRCTRARPSNNSRACGGRTSYS